MLSGLCRRPCGGFSFFPFGRGSRSRLIDKLVCPAFSAQAFGGKFPLGYLYLGSTML